MSATTIVRAEFQLISAGVDFVSSTGVEVKAGTVYGRLYFPEACEINGSFKGTILKDSWQVGTEYSLTRKNRYIEFLASNETYRTLYNSCGRSNLVANRMRTHSLLENCFAAPAAVREEVVAKVVAEVETTPVVKSELELAQDKLGYISKYKSYDADAYQAAEWEVRRLANAAALDNAQQPEPLVTAPAAIFASDWTTEDLYKSTVKQLKVIAEKLNIKVYGTKAEIIAKIQSH